LQTLNGLNALTLAFVALCAFAIGYRFYGLWLARKVLRLDPARLTPASLREDGVDFVKTDKRVLFGFHFSSISAAGPLLGPVLAVQFGYMPGALWIIVGCVVAGAVHDMVILFASVRHQARGIANVAEAEIGRFAGTAVFLAVFFILVLTLAVLSISVVNAMCDSPWGIFTVAATIPIAILMGILLRIFGTGAVIPVSAMGVGLLLVCILVGPFVADNRVLSGIFTLRRETLLWIIPAYACIASSLPVWLLLSPRDYLSSYLKIGTVAILAVSILIVRPELQMAPVTEFVSGGGPNVPGPIFPFLFITIACGALSGFHAIIGTGTTPKMLASEEHILFVGYGAMLTEGFVAVMALIAAGILIPADYFAITASADKFAALGMETVDLPALSAAVREQLAGRPGGAVTLAAGMSAIFSSVPYMTGLVSYWFHFCIMFEAVFIITAIDTGTRVGRFFLQEALGRYVPRLSDRNWWPGIVVTSVAFTSLWAYLVITGDIFTIWPLFGMCNQLLASCALMLGTSMLLRLRRGRYALTTAVPGILMSVVCFWAGAIQIFGSYIPSGQWVLAGLGLFIVALMSVVLVMTVRRWVELLMIKSPTVDQFGEPVLALAGDSDLRA
jgi:carbon starvation protein